MKVAYISSPSFSDVDISLLSILQHRVELSYFLLTYPAELHSAAININEELSTDGILEARSVKDLHAATVFLEKTSFYVANSSKNKTLSFSRIKSSWKLFMKVWKGHYDIIHSTAVPGITTLWLYLFRNKLVLTIHDPVPHSSFNSKSQMIERRLAMKLCKSFILLNKAQEREFIQFYGVNPNKQKIFQSQLSSYNYLRMYSKENANCEERFILFFGKIQSYKGLQFLFPAMKKVHELYPDLNLVVAGKGEYSFDIRPYENLQYLDIRNRFIPDEELALSIQNCLFVVVPYIDATQSGVVMSAFAFFKPCVVTNVGGLPEMVIDNKFGRVVEPSNSQALSEAICELASNPQSLMNYSENIKKEYDIGERSWASIADGLVEIYSNVARA